MLWTISVPYFEKFEWDEVKRRNNIVKHGIDFRDAASIFRSETVLSPSSYQSEKRWLAIGILNSRYICVVYSERDNVCRIISARSARVKERRAYDTLQRRRAQ